MQKKSIRLFAFQSALLWSCVPIVTSFLPSYLNQDGYDATHIGVIMAIIPLMGMLLQPYIGVRADRAASKNRVFFVLMIGTVASLALFPFAKGFAFVLCASMLLAIFSAGISPISESIAIESLHRMNLSYAPVRLAGTLGFSAVSITVGFLMKWDSRLLFALAICLGLLNMWTVSLMPQVKGHQSDGERLPMRALFADHSLLAYLLLTTVNQMSSSVFYTIFPLRFIEFGGTNSSLGVFFFFAAMSEIPFLLFAEKIMPKLGVKGALILAASAGTLRCFLIPFLGTPTLSFLLAPINGLCFIVMAYSMAIHIARTVRKELLATGQTTLGVFMSGGRILGTLIAGVLADLLGIPTLMFLAAGVNALSLAAFLGATSVIEARRR